MQCAALNGRDIVADLRCYFVEPALDPTVWKWNPTRRRVARSPAQCDYFCRRHRFEFGAHPNHRV